MSLVTIAKLRMGIKYEQTASQPMDSFYELYEQWMESRPDLTFDTYNFSFDGSKPVRNKDAIKHADYIILPSESEWRFHCPELWQSQYESHANSLTARKDNYRYPWPVKLPYTEYLEKTETAIEEIKPYFENKTVILWRNERADDEELYRTKTLKGVTIKDFHTIDEIDFSGNINGMKFHNIPTLTKDLNLDRTKKVDFAYWGTSWKDNRDEVIYDLYDKEGTTTTLVGGFLHLEETEENKTFTWARDWRDLLPVIKSARCTLCFNWKDENATTSRYIEALAVGIIPFVWCTKDFTYDKNNTYNICPWQRVRSMDELLHKIDWLRDDEFFIKKLKEYRKNYRKVLLSKKQYSEEFNKRMNNYVSS